MEKQFTTSGNELMIAIKNAALKLQNMEPVYDVETGELLTERLALTMVDFEVIPKKEMNHGRIYAGYRLSNQGKTKRYEGIITICRYTGKLISGTWDEVGPL
ncbi:hypothetical protein [Sporosarcina sp. FSL W7-1283]|uniref:hypothetical protein n=1 Tax=Sporosarcina sp. FSL W7-1283 TaxID=2921560 RepID=UPI0030F9E121